MARYIDADKLISELDLRYSAESEFAEQIRAQPTAEVEEVKHGEWIKHQKLYGVGYEYVCSACEKGIRQYEGQPICSECGAKMDGERK